MKVGRPLETETSAAGGVAEGPDSRPMQARAPEPPAGCAAEGNAGEINGII